MIKLFASDLDGTLLGAMHTVTEPVRRCVREAHGRGAHFALATGRTFRTPDDFGFDGLGCDVVAANGSIILSGEGELLRFEAIDPALVEEILTAFPDEPFACIGRAHTYVRGSREAHDAGFNSKGVVRRVVDSVRLSAMRRSGGSQYSREFVFDQSVTDVLADDICKINCRSGDEGLIAELHAFLAERADKLVNAPFNPSMFEITKAGVNKGAAVATLAGILGIDDSEVNVYGDGGNDIEMLSRFAPFGHAYAPRGGSADARAAASETIGSNVLYAVPRHVTKTLRDQNII